MSAGISLVCPQCNREYDSGERNRCPAHDLRPVLTLEYDVEKLREEFDPADCIRNDIWRYEPLLPADTGAEITLGEGWTTVVTASSIGEKLDVDLALKLEGANPTGSTKDRGSAMATTRAKIDGLDTLVCASTGNAAASIAAYTAHADLSCSIFVPDGLPTAKGLQSRVYGADVIAVEGDYSAAADACRERGCREGWLDRTAGETPYVSAGAQTLGFELAEQSPAVDWITVPMGNGGTIADLWRGWRLFERLGYVDSSPRLLGVQAANVAPIHHSTRPESHPVEESNRESQARNTCADSIDVSHPRRDADAKAAIEESGGTTLTVTDDQIRSMLVRLGNEEGVFAEPASAATVAGVDVAREQGLIDPGAEVIAVITGNGLKDTAAAANSLEWANE